MWSHYFGILFYQMKLHDQTLVELLLCKLLVELTNYFGILFYQMKLHDQTLVELLLCKLLVEFTNYYPLKDWMMQYKMFVKLFVIKWSFGSRDVTLYKWCGEKNSELPIIISHCLHFKNELKYVTLLIIIFMIQWNLVTKRSVITKPYYNIVILLVQTL